MPNVMRLSCVAYNLLLTAYPREFRRRFGSEMAELFAKQMSAEWNRHQLGGLMRVWLTAVCEIVSVAGPLQLRNPALIAAVLSFICSSILTLAFFRAVSP
jgi:hypothetical protein